MTLDGRKDYTISLMARKAKFKHLIRETQKKIDEWIVIAVLEKIE